MDAECEQKMARESQLTVEEPKKVCVVCGDKALGYNFNAITCESCKAFFRRNALKKKIFKCRFSDNCQITISSRRYCQKCRLRKCLQVGMLSELITVQPPDDDDDLGEANWPAHLMRKRHSMELNAFAPPNKLAHCPSAYFGCPSTPTPFLTTQAFSQNYLAHQSCTYPRSVEPLDPCTPAPIKLDQNDYNLPSVSSQQLLLGSVDSPDPCTKIQKSDDEEDPLVPLPKSVLLHLINLCHHGNRPASSCDQATSSISENRNVITCVCRCVCGANDFHLVSQTTETGTSCVEWEKEETRLASSVVVDQRRSSPDNWTDHVFDHADEAIVKATMETVPDSEIIDLASAQSPVVEFPPDMDILKLFRLEELLSANEILSHPIKKSGPPMSFMESNMAVQLMDFAMRLELDMAKRVNAFGTLTPPDQVALFQGAAEELMCLRGLMVYEPSVVSFRPVGYPHRYLRIDVLSNDGHPKLRKFYDSFHESWRKNDSIMLCLSTLALFDANRPNLTDVRNIRVHYSFYLELLRSYLKTLYSPLEAQQVLRTLLQRLWLLKKNLRELSPTLHVEMNPRTTELLLIDVLP